MSFISYSQDGTRWTLRTRGSWFLVVRLTAGSLCEVERDGWYRKAGLAATAVGALTYRMALQDTQSLVQIDLQAKLDKLGLGLIPQPDLIDIPADAPD
jgi:hypothetical protein